MSRGAGRARRALPIAPPPDSSPSPRQFSARWLAARLRALDGPLRGRRFCIALSGGLDSSALLAAMASLRARTGFVLRALHVDHGLNPASAEWARAACAQARRLRVPCEIVRLRLRIARGESLEARAREARYRALVSRLQAQERLLTAHHQDDQLETMLLALLRGRGVRGLAAMEACSRIDDHRLLRPLLPVSRAQLERFARRQHLRWSEDPSNADARFDRNYLRLKVLPELKARWPAAAATASRSAAHLAEAQRLLDESAQRDAASAADGAALRISAMRVLSAARCRALLRYWIAARGLPLPDQRRLVEISGPMLAAREDALPCVRWPGAELRRHGDRLLVRRAPAHDDSGPQRAAMRRIARWDWRRRPQLRLGSGAALALLPDRHGDVELSLLPCPLRVEFRRGGERLQEAHGRVPLKDLLQSHGIAPWQRGAVPLLRAGNRIVAVADLWLEPGYRASSNAAGPARDASARGRLRWRRGDAASE